jgi:hypothetical protein
VLRSDFLIGPARADDKEFMSVPGLSGLLKGILAGSRRPAGNELRPAVDQVAEELDNLNRSTEADFLAVGEKLMELRSAARRITSDMATLTELISGEQGRAVFLTLTRTLDHSREMDAAAAGSGEALIHLAGLSAHIRRDFAGLRNTVSVFRTLCTLTRIETSRLGSAGAGFGDLAADVGPLSESIQASGERILDASGRLDRNVQSAILRGSGLRATQLAELPAMIDGVMDSLRSFDERRARASDSSVRQAAQYEALCGAVDDLVESIQFHDITRQQIEHVAQALRQLGSECGHGQAGSLRLPPNAGSILTLQSSQLAGAAGIFAASVERVERDLDGIAAHVLGMAEASAALMGISHVDQDSFFLRMEGRFTAILKMLGVCAAAQAEIERAAEGLAETIAKMRDSVSEIREIEIRIERIALNAMIRATHIGAAGNALNTIAEAMQGLARQSSAVTDDAAATLDAMDAAVARVASGSVLGANDAADRMTRAVLDLHSSSECSFSRVKQIAAAGAGLAAGIAEVRAGFSAGRLVAETLGHARRELERLAAGAGQSALDGPATAPAQRLDSLAKRYTMRAERDVHQSAAGGQETAPPGETSRAALLDGDLGSNVELF